MTRAALILALLLLALVALPGCADDPESDVQVYDPAGLHSSHVSYVIEAAALVNHVTGSNIRVESGGVSGFEYAPMSENWGKFACSEYSCLITYDVLLLDSFYGYMFKKVFAHEFGHAAGLEHSCADDNGFKELNDC